jgi:phosphoglycerol transferase MdoB-like AlkP superfamily enzyme
MKWFENHLNWTTFFYTVFAWTFGILLVRICLNITGSRDIPGIGEFSFTYQTMIDIAVLITLPVFYWILKRKKRSFKCLLFYLPPLIPMPSPAVVLLFQMPFWLAGWIILLSLKNGTPIEAPIKE